MLNLLGGKLHFIFGISVAYGLTHPEQRYTQKIENDKTGEEITMKEYSQDEMNEKINKASKKMETFYQQGFVNYRGKIKGTIISYSESVAKFLCENLPLLDQIKTVSRKSSYRVEGHDGKIDNFFSGREEEILAKHFFTEENFLKIGKILDYQIPLKNVQKDEKTGKIDLLSFNKETNTLFILELKNKISKETMLRCVLEAYTYKKMADLPKLLKDFDLPENVTIKACPLVYVDGYQKECLNQSKTYLPKLIQMLDAAPVYYEIGQNEKPKVV